MSVVKMMLNVNFSPSYKSSDIVNAALLVNPL